MGISGLLPFVKNSCRPVNIRNYSGSCVAVDAYSWLHKGAFSCAEKLAKGEKTDGYVYYCIKMINMLLDAGVKPIMVFDGCRLASKAGTEKKRRENREKARQMGKEFLCEGKLKEARECFQRSVDVSPEMAYEVIQACRKKSVDCIVAPYEADAQLAYLNKMNIAQIVITEDSDLILFGCEKILFKMDSGGSGVLFEKENLSKSFGMNASKISFEKFRYMCILSGCDYLPSLPGIGLAKAAKFFMLTTNPDPYDALSKLPTYLKMPKLVVSSEYKEAFIKANNTFLYQLVFCPQKKKLLPLNPYPDGMNSSELEYAGKYFSDDIAFQLATGNINVETMQKFDNFSSKKMNRNYGQEKPVKCQSIWDVDFTPSETNSADRMKKVSFIFKDTIKSKISEPCKKRPLEQIENKILNSQPQDEELFAIYNSSTPTKRPKKTDSLFVEEKGEEKIDEAIIRNTEKAKRIAFCPFRKIPSNTVNLFKSVTPSPENIIVSRYFQSSTPCIDDSKDKTPRKLSWLDSIDDEYEISSTSSNMLTHRGMTMEILSEKLNTNIDNDENGKSQKDQAAKKASSQLNKENTDYKHLMKCDNLGFRWANTKKSKLNRNYSLGSDGLSVDDSGNSSDENADVTKTSFYSSPGTPISSYTVSNTGTSLFSEEGSEISLQNKSIITGTPSIDLDNSQSLSNVEHSLELKETDIDSQFSKESVEIIDEFQQSPTEGCTQTSNCHREKHLSNLKKCRRVGLSKKCNSKPKTKTLERQPSIKETLMNFKFTRQPKSILSTV